MVLSGFHNLLLLLRVLLNFPYAGMRRATFELHVRKPRKIFFSQATFFIKSGMPACGLRPHHALVSETKSISMVPASANPKSRTFLQPCSRRIEPRLCLDSTQPCSSLFAMCIPCCAAQKSSLPLDHGWEFRQHVSGESNPAPEWRPATVPGDVHLDLLANKLIPEPFYRDNEAKLQWIQNADWEYRTSIDAAPALLARRHIDLVFEGLDAYAEVYLNSQKILVADNMFREWRVDVKPYLKAGANELLVVFPSPIKTAQKIALTDVWHGQTPAQDKTYLRKAAYEYGWDWGPTFVTSGIWRPARLEAWDDARIADFYPHVRDVSSSLAHVDAELDVVSSVSTKATIALDYKEGTQSAQFKQTVNLVPGINHLVLPVEIQNPHLWYPAGYGAQPIYIWSAKLSVNGKPADAGIPQDRPAIHRPSSRPRPVGTVVRVGRERHSCLRQRRRRHPLRQLSFASNDRAVPAHPAISPRRQHEHDPPLGRRLLRDRRVLRHLRRVGHHGLAGLHVRQRLAARPLLVPRECREGG